MRLASTTRDRCPEHIGIIAMVMTELELREVERKVLFADVVVGANDSALEQRPEAFDRVGVDRATNILAFAVAYGLMLEPIFQEAITGVFVSGNQFNLVAHSLPDEAIQRCRVSALDYLADDVSLAANGSDDADLIAHFPATDMRTLLPMAVLVLAANEGFVHLDDAHQLRELRILHRGAQAMAHIPSGRIGRSNLSLNLLGTDALLGIKHLPEHFKPDFERILRVLKNGSDVKREAISVAAPAFSIRALPLPRQRNVVNRFGLAATRTQHSPVWPAPKEQILFASIIRRKIRHQLPKRHHG
jgi:hypothetical protein